jgi:predicted lipid-binding transport protein (Tim44 family)
MSFFDQLREYREEVLLKRIAQEQSERDAMGDDYDSRVVKLSQEEIDEDYENINLDDF